MKSFEITEEAMEEVNKILPLLTEINNRLYTVESVVSDVNERFTIIENKVSDIDQRVAVLEYLCRDVVEGSKVQSHLNGADLSAKLTVNEEDEMPIDDLAEIQKSSSTSEYHLTPQSMVNVGFDEVQNHAIELDEIDTVVDRETIENVATNTLQNSPSSGTYQRQLMSEERNRESNRSRRLNVSPKQG